MAETIFSKVPHSFSQYLSAYDIPGTVLGPKDSAVNKTKPWPYEFTFWCGNSGNKQASKGIAIRRSKMKNVGSGGGCYFSEED